MCLVFLTVLINGAPEHVTLSARLVLLQCDDDAMWKYNTDLIHVYWMDGWMDNEDHSSERVSLSWCFDDA